MWEEEQTDSWTQMTVESCNQTYFTQFVPGFFRVHYLCTMIDNALQENIVFREKIHAILDRDLAQTRDPIKTIATRVGYQDEKYFSRVFKKTVGIKPTVYRSLYS